MNEAIDDTYLLACAIDAYQGAVPLKVAMSGNSDRSGMKIDNALQARLCCRSPNKARHALAKA